MVGEQRYASDIETILSHRHDNGADYWATPDGRLLTGAPWSTIESALFLAELGVSPLEPVLRATADLIFGAQRPDGRFKVYPKGAIPPCHTINAANALCQLGYAADGRLRPTFDHLMETTYADGGWRCAKFFFGRGPETECSNPLTTLSALNVLRFTDRLNTDPELDRAVEFLLEHWTIRRPIGPCHYGIGTLFMQVEYPFRNYNLFLYTYVLSFFDRAKDDPRFLEALKALESTMVDGWIVVERVVPKLARLEFCRKGQPSELATERYREILVNLGRPIGG